MLSRIIKEYKDVELVGEVFVKHKVNMIYGASGVGKTVSTITAINRDGITPVLFDYDDNLSPNENNCDYIHIDAHKIKTTDKALKEQVIVIDTYHKMDHEIFKILVKNHNTIIIVGHSLDLATRNDIPDAPSEFVNHLASKVFLAYNKKSKTSDLTVFKCRGYRGSRIIQNWMRDEQLPDILK